MTFKEKIVRLRKLKGLTQDQFASAVGVSRQAVYKWESGQSFPEVPKLLEIKLIFGISIDDLLDDSYEVALPEKKKRVRISKAAKEKIEAEVRAEESAKEEPAPVREVKAEPALAKAEAAPAVKAEEIPAAPAAKAEAEVKAEPEAPAAKAEEAPKAEPEKKGFFARLFGRK